ncbi:MAG TPA: hypothetical protein VK895_00280 [Jiangellaceae bacterium]|nr:hypothetical protein [Jiangellaceae bacterium]
MRRLVTSLFCVAVVAAAIVVADTAPTYADPVCQQTDPATGQCLIWVEAPGDPGSPGQPGDDGPRDTGSGHACYWDPAKQGLTSPPAGPVPCSSEAGYWSNTVNCYLQLADPQPGPGHLFWEGVYLDYGAVYQCYQPQTGTLMMSWFPDPPPAAGAGPTPREVAEVAIDQMNMRAIDIGIVPEPGDDRVGIVGMPVWMWAENPDSHTVGPITASASAGGITVTATARLQKLTWDMGDGTKVTCIGAGTPYDAGYGKAESPDCGHLYTRTSAHEPDGTYTVTASSDWVVTWEGAGQSGTILLNGLQRSVEIAVGEGQVLVSSHAAPGRQRA